MLRLIFILIVAYFVWKVVGVLVRAMLGPTQQRQMPRQKGPSPASQPEKPPFQDVKDAEFEDLTPPRT